MKQIRRKIISILLSLAMVLGLLPTVAVAEESYPGGVNILNSAGTMFNLTNGDYLAKNDATEKSTGWSSGTAYVARYDASNGTLYLNGYDVTLEDYKASNAVHGINAYNNSDKHLTINLSGKNSISVSQASDSGARQSAYGICAENLTITGTGDLTVSSVTNNYAIAYGIYASRDLTVDKGAAGTISVTATNKSSDPFYAYGFYSNTANITLNGSSMSVNAGCTGSTSSSAYGAYTGSGSVTVGGGLNVNLTSSGMGIYAKNDDDTTSPAITLDGGSVTVTGTAKHGLYEQSTAKNEGVAGIEIKSSSIFKMEENNNGGYGIYSENNNLSIDSSTVDITGSGTAVYMSKTASSSVSIKNSDVTLTASGEYNKAVIASSTTIDLSTTGTVTAAKGSSDDNAYPIQGKVTLGSGTKCTKGTYVTGIENYTGVLEDGCYKVQFEHYKANPSATVEDVTISGAVNSEIKENVTITLTDDTFGSEISADTDVKDWFTNLPSGMKAAIKNKVEAGATTATITVSGTPTVSSSAALAITIPAGKLTSNKALTVTDNANAKFDIYNLITEARATVTAPVEGQKPAATATSGDSSKYSVTLLGWKLSSGDDEYMDSNSTFTEGTKYLIVVKFKAKDGYRFATDCSFKINDTTAGGTTLSYTEWNKWCELTASAKPAADISLNPSSVDFGSKTKGYSAAPAAQTITITNSGTAETGTLTISLEGTNASEYFTVSGTSVSNIAASGTATFTVQPKTGLGAGTYTATVKVNGTAVTEQSLELKFEVTEPKAAVVDVTISGAVNSEIKEYVTITLTDDTFASVISDGEDVTSWFTNLPSGMEAKIESPVSSGATTATITVSGTPTGSSSAALAITIPKTYLTSNNDLTVTSNDNAKFDIYNLITAASATVTAPVEGQKPATTATAGEPSEYSVTVVDWREPGQDPMADGSTFTKGTRYYITVKFKAEGGYRFATDCSFKINEIEASGTTFVYTEWNKWCELTASAAPAADISLSPSSVDFGSKTKGYSDAPAAQTITITNSGTADTGVLAISLEGTNESDFTVSKTSIANIAAGGTGSFTVQPNAGLGAGTYTATVKVSGLDVLTQSLELTFEVTVPTYYVKITGGAGMSTTGNENQTGLTGAMENVVYTANEGYYFPDDYSVETKNYVSVTRNNYTQITVSGTPTADTELTLTAATAKTKETTPSVIFTATSDVGGTLSMPESGLFYSNDGGNSWGQILGNGMNITGVTTEKGIQVKKFATDENTRLDSDVQTITVTKAATPTGVAAEDCTRYQNDDGKLTGVTAAMEYCSNYNTNLWIPCSGTEVTLRDGIYKVRVKADGTQLASDYIEVTIKGLETTPTVKFTATGYDRGILTKVESGLKYRIGSGDWIDIISSEDIELSDLNVCTIEVVRKGNGSTTKDSEAKKITLQRKDPPSSVTASACTTAANNNGKLTNVDSQMEYRKDDTSTWTFCGYTGWVEGLTSGTYYVRYKVENGTYDTYLASAYKTVQINAYNMPRAEEPIASFTASGRDSGTLSISNNKSTMKYCVDGSTWNEVTGGSIAISGVTAANGIKVKDTGDGTTTGESSTLSIDVTEAAKPTGLTVTQPSTIGGKGSIETDSTHEYSTDAGATYLPCGGKLSDLEAGTYYIRVKASGAMLASETETYTITAYNVEKEKTPNASFTATGTDSGTLSNLVDGGKYIVTGAATKEFTASGTSQELTSVSAGTLNIVKKGNGTTTNDSDAQTISITKASKPTGLKVTQPSTIGGKGSIETNATHEYSIDDGTTYTACEGTLSNLSAGTYYIRVKASGTVLASKAEIYTITAYSATTYKVTVTSSTGGSASANPSEAEEGATITLSVTPDTDYQFSKWEVVSGGVTITDNKFTMPASDVEVKAVFAKKPDPACIHENLVYKKKVEATCIKDGYEAHYVCEDCGAIFEDGMGINPLTESDIRLAATGHNWSTTYSYNTSSHWKVCTVCNEITDKAAHSLSGTSCTVCGYTKTYHSSGGGGGSSSGSAPKTSSATSGSWLQDEKGWYFKPTYGTYPTNSWAKLLWNGIEYWYYFDPNGYMKTGWIEVGGKYYYLNPVIGTNSGMMLTGWQLIDGKWYYFSKEQGANEGALLRDTVTPDNYKVDQNGVWVQ